MLALVFPAAARGEAAPAVPGYVRLHVIAADDTRAAQALKLRVRDAVLAEARALLADCPDAEAAWRDVNAHLDGLEAAAARVLLSAGCADGVRCEAGVFAFPDRRYGEVRVPAGDYRALRVVIGAGRGRNWWCVLYPSLCFPGEYDPEAPRFYSSVLNWLQRLFGGGAA